MGRRCVIEDTDQNVDHKEKPNSGEKKPYISGDSLVRAAPGSERSHLSSPSLRTLELLRDLTVGKDSAAPQRPPSVPSSTIETSPDPFSRIAGMSPYDVLTCQTTLSLMRLDRDAAAWAPRHRIPAAHPAGQGTGSGNVRNGTRCMPDSPAVIVRANGQGPGRRNRRSDP
jgi:hypothetical protein